MRAGRRFLDIPPWIKFQSLGGRAGQGLRYSRPENAAGRIRGSSCGDFWEKERPWFQWCWVSISAWEVTSHPSHSWWNFTSGRSRMPSAGFWDGFSRLPFFSGGPECCRSRAGTLQHGLGVTQGWSNRPSQGWIPDGDGSMDFLCIQERNSSRIPAPSCSPCAPSAMCQGQPGLSPQSLWGSLRSRAELPVLGDTPGLS